VHGGTFAENPVVANLDLAFYDAIGPHVRWGKLISGKAEADRLRSVPEREWRPDIGIIRVWFIFPGLLLSNELYGLIYADLTPGPSPNHSSLRYGWLSPVTKAPEGMPAPEEMARRAALGVAQDKAVWEGCARAMAFGGHSHEVIGRNEKGVQLFHESLARQTGYAGLRYL